MFKQLLGVAASLLFMLPAWASPGDLDGNQQVEEADLILLQRYISGEVLLPDAQAQAGDLNKDGEVNDADAQILRQRLGQVVDSDTGKPLAGVVVEIPGSGIKVTTDGQGRFTLPRPVDSSRILTASSGKGYAPFSLTVQANQKKSFELKLERLTAKTIVLDEGIHRLGDEVYDESSANAADFKQSGVEGTKLKRIFTLDELPDRDPYLRIGTLLGIDTTESIAAGQSNLGPQGGFRNSPSAAFRVYLNGTLVKRITINGDNIVVPLSRWLLKKGTNELLLATASSGEEFLDATYEKFARLTKAFQIFGASYDDIEVANLVLVIPGRGERQFFRGSPE